LLLAQIMESIARLVMLFAMEGRRYVGWVWGDDLWDYYMHKYISRYVIQIWFQSIAVRADYLLMTGLSNVQQLGIYERTMQFVRIPWSLSINLVDRVLMVSYSKEASDVIALRRVYRKATYAIGAAVMAAVAAVAVGMCLFLRILVGGPWAAVIQQQWWIAIPLTIATPFVWNNNLLFQGVAEPKPTFVVLGIAFGSQIGIGCLLIPHFHAAGMFVTMALSQVFCLAYQIRAMMTYFETRSALDPASAP
jgi:O-antigen/teichoic acid export membrane protein